MYIYMELVYLIVFLITLFMRDVENVLLKKENINAFIDEKILLVSEEPSLLQCAQRCRFIDKNAVIDFKNSKCTCIKYDVDEGKEQNGTLTGVFINQRIVKKKTQTSTKPKVTKVMNVALRKFATQTSDYLKDTSDAKFAVDGSMTTASSTDVSFPTWWEVDLRNVFDIKYMLLRSRVLQLGHNKYLYVYTRQSSKDKWKVCKRLRELKSLELNFTCNEATRARYVRIESRGKARITLYEFEVYAPVTV